jgi:hypothetical protein
MRAPILICFTTYRPGDDRGDSRRASNERTLDTWRELLHYEGELILHVADDGSAGEVAAEPIRGGRVVHTRQERHGVGASLNQGIGQALAHSALFMYAADDWALAGPVDLTPWADLLADSPCDERPPIGMVRLGLPHPWLTGRIEMFPQGWAMRLDRHHFAFAHRPALYHPSMFGAYGTFDEDVNAYDCERRYSERFNVATGPDIVLALPHPWEHVGDQEMADIEPRSER